MANEELVPEPEKSLAPRIKTVEYKGFREHKGKVAYIVEQGKVLFTATISAFQTTSTINAAEAIVEAICEAEGIDWKNPKQLEKYEFYDLKSQIGYPYQNPSEFEILKLGIRPDDRRGIFVESWDRYEPPLGNPSETSDQAALPISIIENLARSNSSSQPTE